MANEIEIRVKGNDSDAQRALDETVKAQKKVGDQAKQTSRDFVAEAAAAKILAREIDVLEDHMRDLARELALTSSETRRLELKEKLKIDQSQVNDLKQFRRVLGEVGTEGGRSFIASLRDSLGSMPSELKGAMIAGVVGAAVLTAPLVGGAIGAGVLGAVGGGGIIGGIALAAQDPRVAEAGQDVGARLMDELRKEFGTPFVEPVLIALQRVEFIGKRTIHGLSDEVGDLAKLIDPVVDGLDRAAIALGPGLSDGLRAAQPIVRLLGNELPELADSISYAISAVSEESDGATMALAELFNIIEYGIEFTGDFVAAMSAVFEWLVNTTDAVVDFYNAWNPIGSIITMTGMLGDETQALKNSLAGAKDESHDFNKSTVSTAEALRYEADMAKSLNDAFDRLFGITMSVDEANIRYQKSIDKTIEELKEGKRTLDINSDAGRQNKEAVLDQISAIEDLRQANVANGMSMDEANSKYEKQLTELEKTLLKLGYNKDEVKRLIGAYRDIPSKVSTNVTAPGLAGVLAQMRELDRLYYSSPGFADYRAGERGGHAYGGIVSSAATGGSRGGTVIMNELGPEVARMPDGSIVIPHGQSTRMMENLAGGMGGGGGRLIIEVPRPTGDALLDAFVEGLRFKIDREGSGNVQDYLGNGSN